MNNYHNDVFRIMFHRRFSRKNVRLNWTPTPPHLPRSLQSDIESYWARLPKDHIFNGKLARLKDYTIQENQLCLDLQPTDYQALLYSNAFTSKVCRQWGKGRLSQALGISAILVSQDDALLAIKRSAQVGECPNLLDVPGGHIDVPSDNSAPDIFASMEQELEEEIGLAPHQVDLSLVGMIETSANCKPELIFYAQSPCSKDEIRRKSQTASHRYEYSALIAQPNTIESIDVLLAQPEKFSPSAYGCLLVYLTEVLCENSSYERNE